MRTADVLRRATDYLDRHGVDAPRANAEALLEAVLGVDRSALRTSTAAPDPAQARALVAKIRHAKVATSARLTPKRNGSWTPWPGNCSWSGSNSMPSSTLLCRTA